MSLYLFFTTCSWVLILWDTFWSSALRHRPICLTVAFLTVEDNSRISRLICFSSFASTNMCVPVLWFIRGINGCSILEPPLLVKLTVSLLALPYFPETSLWSWLADLYHEIPQSFPWSLCYLISPPRHISHFRPTTSATVTEWQEKGSYW